MAHFPPQPKFNFTDMEEQLSRIAQAFERIADSLERIEAEGLDINNDVPELLHVVPNGSAFKVELRNCFDTGTPFVIQTND